jgi:hypothetical protein
VSNNFALATLDNDVDVEVQIFNGSWWGTVFQATSDAGDKTTRVFDIAYEQASGHLLLVYRENGTSQIRYRTYNGTSWSAEFSYTLTGGNIKWLELIPKRNSDEMMLIALSDQDNNLSRAVLWNGSSFTGPTPLPVDDDAVDATCEHASGAFEDNSGQALVGYYQAWNWPGYRTRTGSNWSASLDAPAIGGRIRWCKLASNPGSNEILFATLDDKMDVNLVRWSGNAWGSPKQLEKKTGPSTSRRFDLTYEPQGTEALLVYDDNTNNLRYRTWDGFAWSNEMTGPTGGSQPLWNPQAVPGLETGMVFVTYCTDSMELRAAVWNGSSFDAGMVLGTSSAPKEYEVFMTATAALPAAPKILGWQEVQP